jgi:flagellin-like protein
MKKGISPVVATALLLVVAVVAVVGFNTWFNSYQTKTLSGVEQSSQNSGSLEIESLLNKKLYVKNPTTSTLTLNLAKIENITCNFANIQLLPKTLVELDLDYYCNSSQTFTEGIKNIMIISNSTLREKKIYTKQFSLIKPFYCSNLGKWILVPGNPTYGTTDFCVMKYEAKNVGGIPTSQASSTPWQNTWLEARTNCEALGPKYHLITDNEWLTIANNIVQVSQNWNSSVVGTGYVYLGNSDGDSQLEASTTDSNGYYGTNDGFSSWDGMYTGFPSNEVRAYQGQKRTLTLSNNEVIWDFNGNAAEVVNDTILKTSRYQGGNKGWMSYNSIEGSYQFASNIPALKAPPNGWNANQGMGRYQDGTNLGGGYNQFSGNPDFCTAYCSTNVALVRGGILGASDGGLNSGIFSLILEYGRNTYFAFRCVYTP